MHERLQQSPTELCWRRLKYLATQAERISLFFNVYLLCSFIQCRPSVQKKGENRVEGWDAFKSLHQSVQGWQRGGGKWENVRRTECRIEEMPRKQSKKKHAATSHLDGSSEPFLFVSVHSLCVWICKTLLPSFPLPFCPSLTPYHHLPFFLKANFTKISFIPAGTKFLSHSFYVFWLWLPIITLRASVTSVRSDFTPWSRNFVRSRRRKTIEREIEKNKKKSRRRKNTEKSKNEHKTRNDNEKKNNKGENKS